MTPTIEKLKSELSHLSVQERVELARYLIESLDDDIDEDEDAEAAWDVELARRLAEVEQGIVKGEPAAKVFAELRAKYS